MLKYVQVDSDGYAWLDAYDQERLHRLGYAVGRSNDDWILFSIAKWGTKGEIVFETADHVLFDNYLKLLLED